MEAERLVKALKEKGYHIATAESCTGGMVAAEIVGVSGASDVFEEGFVTYSDRIKEKNLHVKRSSLERYTAVSEQVAREMAEGLFNVTGAELSVSVTGYAGPGAAEDGTPAGTVYIGTCFKETKVKKYQFQGTRNEVRKQAASCAIEFALERILE